MPYDKGDFTQQGIDGKVAGGLLLNNKRDVDVLVTSNEDDSTLGAVGVTIEDHLNNLKYAFFGENLEAGEVYEIGAGGGGVQFFIEPEIITQTAETVFPGVELNASGSVDVSAIMLKLNGDEPLYIPLLQDSPSHYIVDDYFSGEYGIYVELTKLPNNWCIFIGDDATTPTVMTAEISAVGEW